MACNWITLSPYTVLAYFSTLKFCHSHNKNMHSITILGHSKQLLWDKGQYFCKKKIPTFCHRTVNLNLFRDFCRCIIVPLTPWCQEQRDHLFFPNILLRSVRDTFGSVLATGAGCEARCFLSLLLSLLISS